jgi:hypothetical protein
MTVANGPNGKDDGRCTSVDVWPLKMLRRRIYFVAMQHTK